MSERLIESVISIHALLAESDDLQVHRAALVIIFLSTLSLRRATGQRLVVQPIANISIHALLAESDANFQGDPKKEVEFLSTLSLRRATGNT